MLLTADNIIKWMQIRNDALLADKSLSKGEFKRLHDIVAVTTEIDMIALTH
jgi:hypothetical protein